MGDKAGTTVKAVFLDVTIHPVEGTLRNRDVDSFRAGVELIKVDLYQMPDTAPVLFQSSQGSMIFVGGRDLFIIQ